MTSSNEYRQFADECLRSACQTKDPTQRERFLDMAKAWVLAAFIEDSEIPLVPENVSDDVLERMAVDTAATMISCTLDTSCPSGLTWPASANGEPV